MEGSEEVNYDEGSSIAATEEFAFVKPRKESDDSYREGSYQGSAGGSTLRSSEDERETENETPTLPTSPPPYSEHAEPPAPNRSSTHQTDSYEDKLPQVFKVKYLGRRPTTGLWGIKHCRKPVDLLVTAAKDPKQHPNGLPFIQMRVKAEGITVVPLPENTVPDFKAGMYAIHNVSYGVQDIVYTRVFAMITVNDPSVTGADHPFNCHAFVCGNSATARKLTYALAIAFKIYASSEEAQMMKNKPRKFAIDLRPPEEISAEFNKDEEAPEEDSEV